MIAQDVVYRYRVPEGPCAENIDTPVRAQQGLVIRGQTLLDLAAGLFDNPDTLIEARDLMRLLIHYQLDGRELVSRTLFNSYRKLAGAPQAEGGTDR